MQLPVPPSRIHMMQGSAGAMGIREFRPAGEAAGVAVVAHGRNGASDQPQMRAMIDACLRRQWQVFAPELCHSAANESAGAASDFTIAAHVADVASVLTWRADKDDRRAHGPAVLIGHSMGAYAAVKLAAQARSGELGGLLAVSPVVSGAALIRARQAMGDRAVNALRDELPHAFTEWPQHDLAAVAPDVTLPAAVIVGSDDTITPPSDAQTLAGWLPSCVWYDRVPGEHHCPSGDAFARSLDEALARLAPS